MLELSIRYVCLSSNRLVIFLCGEFHPCLLQVRGSFYGSEHGSRIRVRWVQYGLRAVNAELRAQVYYEGRHDDE